MCALVRDAEDGEDGDGLGMVRICREDCALRPPIPQPVKKLASGSKGQVKVLVLTNQSEHHFCRQ